MSRPSALVLGYGKGRRDRASRPRARGARAAHAHGGIYGHAHALKLGCLDTRDASTTEHRCCKRSQWMPRYVKESVSVSCMVQGRLVYWSKKTEQFFTACSREIWGVAASSHVQQHQSR
jgi:hypothetical protein